MIGVCVCFGSACAQASCWGAGLCLALHRLSLCGSPHLLLLCSRDAVTQDGKVAELKAQNTRLLAGLPAKPGVLDDALALMTGAATSVGLLGPSVAAAAVGEQLPPRLSPREEGTALHAELVALRQGTSAMQVRFWLEYHRLRKRGGFGNVKVVFVTPAECHGTRLFCPVWRHNISISDPFRLTLLRGR